MVPKTSKGFTVKTFETPSSHKCLPIIGVKITPSPMRGKTVDDKGSDIYDEVIWDPTSGFSANARWIHESNWGGSPEEVQ